VAELGERFWSKVDRSAGPDACWPWMAYRNRDGYGKVGRRGIVRGAHRMVLENALGRPLREGYESCHRCDNPPCVNPLHLYEGTHKQNMADMIRAGHGFAARQPVGAANGNAKLTEDDVLRIRAADLSRYGSLIALARKLGVCDQTIREIRIGKRWPHLIGGQ